jgi:ELWxxDGT repeat protein
MKNIYKIIAMLIVVCINMRPALHAQNFHVLDIRDSKDAYPANNFQFSEEQWENSVKYGYAVLNHIAYFTANDGINGEELWRSDGTAAGTWAVKNINPNYLEERMYDITVSGGKIFFKVDNGSCGQELWKSDGTGAGTVMVFSSACNPMYYLTDVKGTLYFMKSFFGTADQLWKTDGTPEGTVMVADLYQEVGGYRATKLTNVNGRLFFVLETFSDGPEIFTNDGTAGSTHLVKDLNIFGGSYPSQLTAVNGVLCFSAYDGTARQIWVSDGTDAGTYKASNPKNILVNDLGGVDFTVKNKSIYFSGDLNDGNGSRLCFYNTANAANTVKALNPVNPGYSSRNLYNITNVNGILFFTVYNGIDQVLWKSDGSIAGTMQVKNINPGGRNIYWYKEFENADGTLLFSFYDDIHGSELWKSDGTEAGTVLVKEITPGVYSAQVGGLTYMGNKITFFLATDEKKGFELWRTDGTKACTNLVKNINVTSTYSSSPYMLTASADGNKLLFGASDTKYGTELRITDGTAAGTQVVKDLLKGFLNSNPANLVNFKNETYFFADILDITNHTTSDVRTIRKLCKTDGTNTTTKILSLPSLESIINSNGYVYTMEAASNLLYLVLYNSLTAEYELWRTDGTNAGTYAVKIDMPAYYNIAIKGVGNKLFFSNYDFTYGNELFVSDGTAAGTVLVKDITPGTNSSNLNSFTAFNDKLYFAADYGYGPFVWLSDGTETGTSQVKPAILLASFNPFAQANGKLFFPGVNTVGLGNELYATDGTITYFLRDIFKGPASSYPNYLTGGDTLVYFFANDGIHGQELWKSNGTKEGTRLVKDISEFGDTYASNLVTVHNEVFFMSSDVLWQSDGTKNGTHTVEDANLIGVTGLSNFTAFDNKLAFTGFAQSTGIEIYVGDSESFVPLASAKDAMKTATIITRTTVYPNPVKDVLNIYTGSKAIICLTDQSGKILLTKPVDGKGSINVSSLPTGLYYLRNNTTGEMLKVVIAK